MCGDALFFEHFENGGRHFIVDDALAHNGAFFFAVSCGRIILVFDDKLVRIFCLENFFCLAFV